VAADAGDWEKHVAGASKAKTAGRKQNPAILIEHHQSGNGIR